MANTFCVQFSKFILIFINFIFFVMGGAIAGMSGYLLANGASLGFNGEAQKILSPPALYASIIFGSAILVVSVVGCVSAMKAGCCGKMFLVIYSCIIGVVILAELAAGATILVVSGKIGAMKGTDIANKTTDEFDKIVNNFIDQTYAKCCVKGKDGKLTPNTADVVCKAISTQLDGKMCTSESTFKQEAINWLAKYTKPLGIGAIIIAVVELLCIGAACHITCHAKTPEQEQADAIKKQRQQQVGGGDLAYGGTSTGGAPLAGSYA